MISSLSGTIILLFIEILESENCRIVFRDIRNNAQLSFVYMILLVESIRYKRIINALHLACKTLNFRVFKS